MATTNMVEEITAKVLTLPVELQQETLDFIEFIAQRAKNGVAADKGASQLTPDPVGLKRPFKSVLGSLEHLNVHVTMEDIAEVRREMWANFPREEPR